MTGFLNLAKRAENGALIASFAAIVLLPLLEFWARPFRFLQIAGSDDYLKLIVLWVTFLGGLLATRESDHIKLSTSGLLGARASHPVFRIVPMGIAAGVLAVLAISSIEVLKANREAGSMLSIGAPVWIFEIVMPLALAIMAARFVWQGGASWRERIATFAIVPAIFAIGFLPAPTAVASYAMLAVLFAAVVLGAPVFVGMAGVGLVMFFADEVPVSAVPAEIYRLLSSPTLPAIPLLTGAGYILAESKASTRLVRLFAALFGWMPGGLSVLVAAVCAMFTAFTGGSGVTILALGGLVYGILREDNYPKGFSLGLVTASGSLGLLFPPSVAVVLYSVVARVPADKLYIAGLLPSVLLVVLVAAYGMWIGRRVEKKHAPFSLRELAHALWAAKWELSIPGLVVFLFFSGLASMVEAAAAGCAFTIVVVCFITRDLHPTRELPTILIRAGVLIGAVMILLSSALGLTSYLVDAQIPDQIVEWMTSHVESKILLLLLLNLMLLVLGSLFEIFAAIIILAPIVAPLGVAYGIDPVHLGVIFLVNLELGFLCPPVGLNLFLSASRFREPLPSLYKTVLPFLAIMAVGVLLVTYVPALSIGTSTPPPADASLH